MKEEKTIIYFRESLLQSVLADTYLFGIITLSFWINYQFIGNGNLLKGVLLVMFVLFVISKGLSSGRSFTSKKDLIDYLTNQ